LPDGVGRLEGYTEIGILENIGHFSNQRAVVFKGDPFVGGLFC
jgi:hypothetical protein